MFGADEAIGAFEYLQKAKHIGKIVIDYQTKRLDLEKTHLITGGLGGIGLALAERMVSVGAKNIKLISRRAPTSEEQNKITMLNIKSAAIEVIVADITKENSLTRFKNQPIGWVVHAAGSLCDGFMHNQDWSKYETVFAAKVSGTLGLLNR